MRKNLTPYLMFNGKCEEAMKYYADCFEGELGKIARFKESPLDVPDSHKERVMHVEMKFWAGSLMGSDYMEGAGFDINNVSTNIHLNLGFDSIEKMESTFNKLKDGGKVTQELQDAFWGDKFGMLEDKFGTKWIFNCVASL